MDPTVITAVFQGAVVLLGALGITAAQRSNRTTVRVRDHRALQRRYLVALSHVFTLETDLAERGLPVPRRPKELDDDDDGLPPAPVPVPAS